MNGWEAVRRHAMVAAVRKGAKPGHPVMDYEDVAADSMERLLARYGRDRLESMDEPAVKSMASRAVGWILLDGLTKKAANRVLPISQDSSSHGTRGHEPFYESLGIEYGVMIGPARTPADVENRLDFEQKVRTIANRLRLICPDAVGLLEEFVEPGDLTMALLICESNERMEYFGHDMDLKIEPRHIREALGITKRRYYELLGVIRDVADRPAPRTRGGTRNGTR